MIRAHHSNPIDDLLRGTDDTARTTEPSPTLAEDSPAIPTDDLLRSIVSAHFESHGTGSTDPTDRAIRSGRFHFEL